LFWEEVRVAQPLADELIALLEPLAEQHGLELWTVEVAGGARHRIVRVYLDREGGIDIDTIAAANLWLSDALDSVERLAGPYTLEVSSPGIDRALRTREHFERFAGRRAVLHTSTPIDGRSRLTGTIEGLDGDDVILQVDGTEYRVRFESIERARLKTDFAGVGERSGDTR
jgi:ribosome maturation factor RimP